MKAKWTLHDSNINLPAILNDPRYGRRDKQIDIFSRVSIAIIGTLLI